MKRNDDMCCPAGRPQGGDVDGERPIDMFRGQGEPMRVADASFDPGYPLDTVLMDGKIGVTKADMIRGFATYGKVIGEPEDF